MTGCARGADGVEHAERRVLRGDPDRQGAVDAHLHGLGTGLAEALGRQHMLHLGRADAERECPEGAVRRRVRVAADHHGARQGQPQFRSDDVDDALPAVPGAEARDPGVIAVAAQRLHLRGAHRVGTAHTVTVSGNVMVHRGHNQAGPAHRTALEPESFERLGRGHLVDEVEVHVEQ